MPAKPEMSLLLTIHCCNILVNSEEGCIKYSLILSESSPYCYFSVLGNSKNCKNKSFVSGKPRKTCLEKEDKKLP